MFLTEFGITNDIIALTIKLLARSRKHTILKYPFNRKQLIK